MMDWRDIVVTLTSTEPQQDANPDPMIIVFAADVDRAQSYVFESDKLPEIRGGSYRLIQANQRGIFLNHLRDAYPQSAEDDLNRLILYADGGSTTLLLPDDIQFAEALKVGLQRNYAHETALATVSAVYRRFRLSDVDSRFGDISAILAALLRREKQQKQHTPFIETMPYQQVCASCEKRPAFDSIFDQAICRICNHKREADKGQALRKLIAKEIGLQLDTHIEQAQSLQELNATDTEGEIAVIYADGDRIGRHIKGLTTPEDFTAFRNDL